MLYVIIKIVNNVLNNTNNIVKCIELKEQIELESYIFVNNKR